jgi:hypothetical protein
MRCTLSIRIDRNQSCYLGLRKRKNQGTHTIRELLNNSPRKLLEQATSKTRTLWLFAVLGETQVVLAVAQYLLPEEACLLEVVREIVVVSVDGVVPKENPEGEETNGVEVLPFAVRPTSELSLIGVIQRRSRGYLQRTEAGEVTVLKLLASLGIHYDASGCQ